MQARVVGCIIRFLLLLLFTRIVQKVRKLIQMGIMNFIDIVSLVSINSHYNVELFIVG